jgi:hypothetical protein
MYLEVNVPSKMNKYCHVSFFHVRRGGADGGEKEEQMKEVTSMSSLFIVGGNYVAKDMKEMSSLYIFVKMI